MCKCASLAVLPYWTIVHMAKQLELTKMEKTWRQRHFSKGHPTYKGVLVNSEPDTPPTWQAAGATRDSLDLEFVLRLKTDR